MKNSIAIKSLTAAIALGLAGPAIAQEDPETLPDETWISLSGTVTSTTPETFKLDYGDGLVTVEMDDWDAWGDTFPLMDGDKVTVYGAVDDNVFAEDTIEAASVYVEDLNSFFYASPADEEEIGVWAVNPVVVVGNVDYVGTVQSVSPMTDSFTIDTGKQELTVDTDALLYDPLDDEGFQKIEVGDVVRVEGTLDEDFFTNNDLIADSIITLVD